MQIIQLPIILIKEAIMKRFLCLLFVAFLILTLSVSAFATVEVEDSLTFDIQVYEILENSKKNNTVKIYNGYFIGYFAEEVPIDEIIQDENLLDPYYVVRNGFQNAEYFYMKDNQAYKITINPPDLGKTLDYITSPEQVLRSLPNSVELQNVYYLNSESSYNGIYIYYVTDKGDYVYYQENANDDDGYLFALSEFYDIAKEAYEIIQEENTGNLYELPIGGPTLLSDIVDISEYQITPGNPVLLYVGLAAAVGIVGVGVFLLVRRKRTRRASR